MPIASASTRQNVKVPDHPPTFADWAAELSRIVGQQPNALPWSDVEVVDVRLGLAGTPDRPRFTVAEFEERWADLLLAVDRDWVNLSACGVQDGHLVVAVEWVPRTDDEHSSEPAAVSVNLSGAAGAFDWPW